MPPKISVVVPSFNTGNFIETTLQSIVNQDYPNIECIVMDGGSTDGTLEILKKYEGRITWTSEKDKGQSDAINKGLQKTTGDIMAFLNADDVYEPGCFRKVADYFQQHPATQWLYGKCYIIDKDNKEIRRWLTAYKHFWQKRYTYNRILLLNFIPQPAAFWRRELWEEIGLFDVNEHWAMDYDYWLRAGVKYPPGFIDDYLARFRFHAVSKSSRGYVVANRTSLELSKKYGAAQQRGYLLPLQYLNYYIVIGIYSMLKLFASGKS